MMYLKTFERQVPEIYKNASLNHFQDSNPKLFEFITHWLKDPTSLFIRGKPGVGKTYFIHALGRELARLEVYGYPLIHTSSNLDGILLEASKSDNGDRYQIRTICNADILIIDDVGREMKYERTKRQYFEIIDYRYSYNKLTIMVSNHKPNDLQDLFDDAALSRLQTWEIIEMTGNDRRQKE